MDKTNTKAPDRELAYFRFALIAPVIQGTFADVSIAAYCRRVTERLITRPMEPHSITNPLRWRDGLPFIGPAVWTPLFPGSAPIKEA